MPSKFVTSCYAPARSEGSLNGVDTRWFIRVQVHQFRVQFIPLNFTLRGSGVSPELHSFVLQMGYKAVRKYSIKLYYLIQTDIEAESG